MCRVLLEEEALSFVATSFACKSSTTKQSSTHIPAQLRRPSVPPARPRAVAAPGHARWPGAAAAASAAPRRAPSSTKLEGAPVPAARTVLRPAPPPSRTCLRRRRACEAAWRLADRTVQQVQGWHHGSGAWAAKCAGCGWRRHRALAGTAPSSPCPLPTRVGLARLVVPTAAALEHHNLQHTVLWWVWAWVWVWEEQARRVAGRFGAVHDGS